MRIRTLGSTMIAAALTIAVMSLWAPTAAAEGSPGAVYTMSNAAAGNSILVFEGATKGKLKAAGEFPTGGLGSGGGLGSQSALALTDNHRFLLAVNAGSHDITSFSVKNGSLKLADRVPSGGRRPISVTVDRNLVYVLNAGGAAGDADNISGFVLEKDGDLTPIPGSTRPLSATSTGPAQIAFSPDGDYLVVTEKNTNSLSVYTVCGDGIADGPQVYPSAGMTPFGFSFGKQDLLVVAEAFGGAAGASSASSYDISAGEPEVVSPSVPTTQTSACWLAVTDDGRFAYTANTGSGTITGYSIDFDGTLTLLNADGRTAVIGTGSRPSDITTSGNGRFLFQLSPGATRIDAFRIGSNGSLTPMSSVAGLPGSTVGLVAR